MGGSENVDEMIEEAYRRSLEPAQRAGVRTFALLCAVLFPAFWLLDRIIDPELALLTWPLRLFVSAVMAGITSQSHRVQSVLSLYATALILAVIALDQLILLTGGSGSPYYPSMTMLLLSNIILVPLPPRWHTGIAVGLWLQWLLLVSLRGPAMYPEQFAIANFFFLSHFLIGIFWIDIADDLRRKEFMSRLQIQKEEQEKTALLLNILPAPVAEELRHHRPVPARLYPDASILFTDFVGFSGISRQTNPRELVHWLDWLFSGFDRVIQQHGLEKLKTIGDAYMCAGGIPEPRHDHWLRTVLAGLELLAMLDDWTARQAPGEPRWRVRVGVHRGPVVAGVVGRHKFAYDVWGDTVNIAARLESAAAPGCITITADNYRVLEPLFDAEALGPVELKGYGQMSLVHLTRIRPGYARDAAGRQPNAEFWRRADQLGLIRPLPPIVQVPVEEEPEALHAAEIEEFGDDESGVRPTEEAPWAEASWPGKRQPR